MRKMKNRLKSSAGETIGEVLISTLVAALSLMILAMMIASAGKLVIKSKNFMDDYVKEENGIVTGTGSAVTGTLKFSDGGTEVPLTNHSPDGGYTVNIYVNDQISGKPVAAYTKGG